MQKTKIVQILFLYAGTVFAWFNVLQSFRIFYANEGTIFKIQDCVGSNPVLAPCFWGALGFLAASIWASWIFLQQDLEKITKHQKRLMWFLLACVMFGFGNVAYEALTLNSAPTGTITACGGKNITNVFQSSCFYGSTIFLISFIVTIFITRKLTKLNSISS